MPDIHYRRQGIALQDSDLDLIDGTSDGFSSHPKMNPEYRVRNKPHALHIVAQVILRLIVE